MTWNGRIIAGMLGIALGAVTGVRASAQVSDSMDAPPMAMGAGRMVRGTITAVSADKLTLKTETGDVYTVALTPNTQLRHGRDQMKIADVHVGDGVGAMGELDQPNKTVHALFVAVVSAEDLKKARDAMGKTFISGTVTAIDETRLTIKRTDNVVQVIEVDEDTSFRKGGRAMAMALGGDAGLGAGGGYGGGRRNGGGPGGGQGAAGTAQGGAGTQGARQGGAGEGESITLADIKVGNVVAGPGAIKNGVFVPKTLGVSDAAAQRPRRRSEGAAPGSPSTPGTPPPMPPSEELR